jgi:hypothetical protein
MTPVNRILMLKGVPLLRDLPPLNRVPGFRGIANVRQIDFPDADCARLAAVCGAGKATFLTPNHPEFFTDWMIDKFVVSKVSPLAASWATNGVVNGLGPVAQKFWLANNLIAQIPGSNGAARDHSVSWAAQGHGVLLHPEGMVGWHGDWVAPLMPGAAEMAAEALDRGRAADSAFQAWIAPIVWKFKFLRDVDAELGTECAYVEGRLKIAVPRPGSTPAERIHAIYGALLEQEEERAGLAAQRDAVFSARLATVAEWHEARIAESVPGVPSGQTSELLRAARRWQRERADDEAEVARVKSSVDTFQRLIRIGPFAWASDRMTQEQAAEHLKRIRNDYCAGTVRDTLNRFVPQPAGPRRVIIRVAEPIAVHDYHGDAVAVTDELRRRLQAALDAINADLAKSGEVRGYKNPFAGG